MSKVTKLGDTIHNMRKTNYEMKFAKAAHELMEFNNSAAMVLPIPNTSPQQYIAIGTSTEICGLLLPRSLVANAVESAISAMPETSGEVITIGFDVAKGECNAS